MYRTASQVQHLYCTECATEWTVAAVQLYSTSNALKTEDLECEEYTVDRIGKVHVQYCGVQVQGAL